MSRHFNPLPACRLALALLGAALVPSAALAQPASSTPLGGFSSPTTISLNTTFAANQVQWFSIVIPDAYPINLGTYLDLYTNAGPSSPLSSANTEVALYSATCSRLALDDNDGPGNYSALSFGCTIARPAVSGSLPFDGRDGSSLAPGTYYLAVGAFDSTFPSASCLATSTSAATGQVTITATLGQCITANATPSKVPWGSSTTLTVNTGGYAASSVTADLTSIGGAANIPLLDDGQEPDLVAADGIFSTSATPSFGTVRGIVPIPFTVVVSGNAVPTSLTLNIDDAGDSLASALSITGNPDGTTPLPSISGELFPNDADIFYFRISEPAIFSATTLGGSSANTQLFLFDPSGVGVAMNDDDPLTASPQSSLSPTFIPASPGNFYLAIAPFDKDPLDKAGMELWNDAPVTTERSPDGPGGVNPLSTWSSSPASGNAYTITLTGASAVPGKPAPVPACLAGWFAFDDGACDNMGGKEQTSNNAAGGGSNGTYGPPGSGPTNMPNAFAGSALFFDGIDDYIDVPNYSTATITSGQAGSFSAMAWINPDAAASTSGNLTIIDTKGTDTVGYRFFLRPASGLCGSSAWELALELRLGGTPTTIASGICIGKSNWSNIAVTASWGSAASVTPSIRFYTSRNAAGLSQKTTPSTTSMPNVTGNNAATIMRIGARAGASPSDYFHGLMDEVMLFKCAISDSVIAGIHAAGPAGVSKAEIQAPWEFASQNESIINIPITLFNTSTDTKVFDLFYAASPQEGPTRLCNVDGFHPAQIVPPVVSMPPRSSQIVWLHLTPDFRFDGHACYTIRAIDRQTGQTFSDTGTVVDNLHWWASIPPTTDPLIRVVPVGGTINFPFVLRNTGPMPRTIQYKVHALDADTWSMNSPIRIQIPGSPAGNPVFGNALVAPESQVIIPVTATLLNQPGVALTHEIALFADVNADNGIAFEEDLASMAVRASSLPLDPCVYGGHSCSCVADFDDGSGGGFPDCGVTIDDLLYYLVIFENGVVFADIDDGSGTGEPDGGVTIDDLLYFLVRFEQGC